MAVPLAKPYVEQLFAEKNLDDIYWAISVVEKDRELPDEFWLFSRVYEWAPSRSGVWQYYEGLSADQFKRVSEELDRFGLVEIAKQYRLGQRTWDGPTQATEVDEWLDSHAAEIHYAVFMLIADKRDCLTDQS